MYQLGTFPTDEMHLLGTVPTDKMHPVETAHMLKMHPIGPYFSLIYYFELDFGSYSKTK